MRPVEKGASSLGSFRLSGVGPVLDTLQEAEKRGDR